MTLTGEASAGGPGSPGEHGVVSILKAGLETPAQRRNLTLATVCALITLLGFFAISGAHLGSSWKAPVAGIPRPVIFWSAVVSLAVLGVATRVGGRDRLARLGWMMAAYLIGNALSGSAHRMLPIEEIAAPAWRFIASRALYAATVTLPMFLLLFASFRDRSDFHFGIGRWQTPTRLASGDRQRSWARTWLMFLMVVAVPLFFLMQAAVGFGPLRGGRLPGLLVPIVLMALANAFAEELMFRGLLHGAAVGALGPALGIWTIGILFGLHHWGASFGPLASLAGALLVGAGSVVFAKSVLETRGLMWAVTAHALINVGMFSAYYVAA